VADLREVGSAPWTFAAVLGLLIVAALTQTLFVSVRAQRRDTAILRTLGFVRRQVHAAVRWQASITVLAGLVVGVPLGVAIGSVAWRRVATSLGVEATPAPAWLWLGGLTVATLTIGNLVALWPARRAGRLHPAEILRSE
jgi:ABC-type lipoprotein release transport system permease subunit